MALADSLRRLVAVPLLTPGGADGAVAVAVVGSLTTDKDAYAPGESLRFHITAQNVSDQDLVLQFGSSLQSQYVIDNGPPLPEVGLAVLTQRSIPAGGA